VAVDLDLARARFKLWREADQKQLKREEEDCEFYDNKQWPAEILRIRQGTAGNSSSSVPAVPARPCITVNKVKDRVRHVLNEILQADLGLSLVPADDWGGPTINEDEIETREGLIRRIQRDSKSQAAISWSGERATIAGRGYFGIMTKFVDAPADAPLTPAHFDQEVVFRRFYDQRAVGLDPAHEEPDGSDAEWAFVRTFMPWEQYKADHPRLANGQKNQVLSASDKDFGEWVRELPEWFELQKEQKTLLVVEYWYYEYSPRDIVLLDDSSVMDAELIDAETLKAIPDERRRTVYDKRVKMCKIDGRNETPLDECVWPGRYIPIIKVLGEEIQPYDQQKRAEGMVRTARDSQQAFNYLISSAVEVIGLGPKARFMAAAGQFEQFEGMWDASVTRTIQRLEYNAKTPATGDVILPPPQILGMEPPIQAMAMMITHFDAAIASTTGIPDPMMGNVDPAVRSGKAIHALLDTALRGTSNYMNNLVRSVQYAGKIVNDLLKPIYGNRPGRLVRMVTGESDTQTVMLGQPHVMQGDQPVPVGMAPGQMPPSHPQAAQAKTYELTDAGANGNIAVKVSKHFETRREQEWTQIAELLAANPQRDQLYGDLFFKYSDGPGNKELAERAQFGLLPQIQQAIQSGKPPDLVAMQKVQAQDAIIKQMQQVIENMQRKIDAKETESAAKLAQAEMDNSTKIAVAQIQAGAQQAVAEMKETMKALNQQVEQNFERIRLTLEGVQEHRLAEKEHIHTLETQRAQHGHDLHQLAHEHEHEMNLAALEPQVETT